jgi:osmotically-inducible protein OsmY
MKTLVFKTDSQLRKDVIDEIERDWRFKAAELGVEVDQGIVTLTGTVSSYPKLMAAADIAAEIVRHGVVTLKGSVDYWYQKRAAGDRVVTLSGVSAIDNHITVVPPSISDHDIRANIERAVERRIPLAARHITISVKGGLVTLSGNVQFYSDRTLAEKAAWMTEGVRTVINKLVATW